MKVYLENSFQDQNNTAEYDEIYRSKHKQDNNNTAEYDKIYRSKHKQTITMLQNMIKYTGLNINKQ